MILSSAVWRKPAESDMFRKSFITGEHTKHPQQIILQARCMHLKQAREQLKLILKRTGTKGSKPYTGSRILPGEISGAGRTSGFYYHPNKDEKETLQACHGNL